MEYLNQDITDKINILPDLWIKCDEITRSKLVSYIIDQAKSSTSSYLSTATKIFNKDPKSFLELYRWVGMRDEMFHDELHQSQSKF